MNHLLRAALLTGMTLPATALAADHAEAPNTQYDPAADIADYYVWHEGGQIQAVLTYNPFMIPGDDAVYDAGVVYTLHFDVDGDAVSDHDIDIRFGQASSGNWGVQVSDLPGASAPVRGQVETVIAAPGGQVFAGMRDDPFFFNLAGFLDTLATGTLSFDGTDDVAGVNVMTIAIQFDAGSLLGTDTDFQSWATSGRL